MERLRQQAKDLFRDALRNKHMEAETMKNWSEMLNDFDDLADKEMPEVEDKLGEADDAENRPADQRDRSMKEAVEEQAEVLEKMRDAMRKANRVEQSMEAGTFVNRLRAAARATKGVAGALRESVLRGITQGEATRTAGLDPDALDKDDYTGLHETAKRQDRTRGDIASR